MVSFGILRRVGEASRVLPLFTSSCRAGANASRVLSLFILSCRARRSISRAEVVVVTFIDYHTSEMAFL